MIPRILILALTGAFSLSSGEPTFPPDELDALLAEVQAPVRFQAHTARFSVKEIQHAMLTDKGTDTWGFFLIKDGERYIGYMPKSGFHGGTFYLLTHDPAQAVEKVPLPTERFHIDNALGAAFRTDHFLPDKNGSKEWGYKDVSTWEVQDGGAQLVLKRRFKGAHLFNKWEHNFGAKDKTEQEVDHTGIFVLRCDSRLGYLIEATWQTGLKPVKTYQYVSLMPPHLSNPWFESELHQRVAICSAKEPGWIGHANNYPAVDASDNDGGLWTLRDGGFAVYLDLKNSGWSWGQTLRGGDAGLSVCNVHSDQDLCVRWPKDLAPGEDGLVRHTVQVRQVRLPPEATQRVWKEMKMLQDQGQQVCIPLGRWVDFEDQPFSRAQEAIGMTFGNGGFPEISQSEAHSRKRSMVVKGTLFPYLPQVVLKPKVRYRMEAWMKVVSATPEQKVALKARFEEDALKAKVAWEKKVEKAKKDGKEPPIYTEQIWQEPGEAEGWMTGHFYLWSPHNAGDRVLEQTTTHARAGQDWQQVVLEFDSPEWGPFLDVRFVASGGGVAYVDDFCLREVGPANGAPAIRHEAQNGR